MNQIPPKQSSQSPHLTNSSDRTQEKHEELTPMTMATLEQSKLNLDQLNAQFAHGNAKDIIKWSARTFGDGLVMSTSFGIQSALMLHLATSIIPDIPVIWVDTGYLHGETYRFAQQLTERLNLNLKVYQSHLSPARMEALYGKLWEKKDVESLNLYDQIRKVEPMQRALKELGANAWLAGLRRDQTEHRQQLPRIGEQSGIYKILPILDWHSRDVHRYLVEYDLPYHPLFDQGYMTVGDWHSSRPISLNDEHERDTRFQGMKQECGLHLPKTAGEAQSFDSSFL